ncbi:SDR family oxidoreductase [Marixanthomonas sp. SCSIO 43207]|uniref:SDR family oxidoreductase n=1 Tax=Marixanthomonas sp. SCSIO 43207 TaxID=2779360 RepID=UPI001CA8BD8A|nr:SDR family oxidoreductase [Marixanthomonas sp. SCSIO 43207]UAB82053.1 SDR family oxidoreductase [Marixanthomonas sp. SCSIO 43207]
MEKVLVVGANGTTGKKIVEVLDRYRNYAPVAMIRHQDQAEQFEKKDIETVMGDLEKNVSHTVTRIHKIIFAAGSGGATSDEKTTAVDQEGAKKLIDLAKIAGIRKFVMLSSMGADNPEQVEDLQHYLKAKQNADEHLRNSGMNYSIVRPGALTNDEGKGKIKLAKKLNERGSITRDDVAETLVAALHDDIAPNQTFEILQGETEIEEALKEV